ncbi:MAG: helix-turn-helix transcriptional regulator [Bacteroidales bacterium]|nr:helix-turn-helix transcriptional regulator [Bacteroidales bacterium]
MSYPVELRESLFPDCPIRNILSRISDKWSLLVLHSLSSSGQAMRFSSLQKALPDISQKVLSSTLKHLVEDGLITRTVFAEVPPHVEYDMSERGLSFMQVFNPVIQWAIDNFEEIVRERNEL